MYGIDHQIYLPFHQECQRTDILLLSNYMVFWHSDCVTQLTSLAASASDVSHRYDSEADLFRCPCFAGAALAISKLSVHLVLGTSLGFSSPTTWRQLAGCVCKEEQAFLSNEHCSLSSLLACCWTPHLSLNQQGLFAASLLMVGTNELVHISLDAQHGLCQVTYSLHHSWM